MTDHLSTLQIKKLCVSALPKDELVAASLHTAECQSCQQRFVEELNHQRGSVPFDFTLEPESWFQADHIDFDLLVALADKTLDQETSEIVNIHLQGCENCREDVRSFLAFRESKAGELDVSYARSVFQQSPEGEATPWWRRVPTPPVYALAGVVLVAAALLIAVFALSSSSKSLEAGKQDQRIPGSEHSPGVSPSLAPNAFASPATDDGSIKVAILKDRSGAVTIDKDGHLSGLDDISENSRKYIARAALSERVEVAEVVRRLAGNQSGLRGTDDRPQEFKLLYPVRSVVSEDRPVFHWQRLSGASSYRVYVLDENGKQAGQSEELGPTQTQWKAPARLRRGLVFSWVVTAIVDGKKVVSPSVSEPETKFALLSTTDFKELGRLRKSNSHLALGTFCARVGLWNEAEREFESLIKLNPDSGLAQKLLQSVRSIRREN